MLDLFINYSNRLPHFIAFTYRIHTKFRQTQNTNQKPLATSSYKYNIIQHTTQHRKSIILHTSSSCSAWLYVVPGACLAAVIKPYSQRISTTNKQKLYKTCPNTRKDRYKNGIPTFECRCGIFQFCPSQETRPRRIAPAPSWFHFKQHE